MRRISTFLTILFVAALALPARGQSRGATLARGGGPVRDGAVSRRGDVPRGDAVERGGETAGRTSIDCVKAVMGSAARESIEGFAGGAITGCVAGSPGGLPGCITGAATGALIGQAYGAVEGGVGAALRDPRCTGGGRPSDCGRGDGGTCSPRSKEGQCPPSGDRFHPEGDRCP